MNPQIDKIRRGVDILVATPGRLLDLQQQGHLDLSTVQILVLDEADRMLDMGFIHDVKKILSLIPQNKQSLLFSATFSAEIKELANSLLSNPQSIQVTPSNTTVQRIRQVVHPVGRNKKKALLAHIVQTNNWNQVLVFTRTKFGANHVAEFLNKTGITAMALHGNKSQSARTQALAGFKSGELRVLVATDIAARGIDIDDLPHVVNFEIPNVSEDYVHRIGRTGRAGASGEAISLVSLDEQGFMQEIEKFTNQSIPVETVEDFAPDASERAEPIAMGRQTLWGGVGRPPSRDVMAKAARAARQEMLERIRDKKKPTGSANNTGPSSSQRPHAASRRNEGHTSRSGPQNTTQQSVQTGPNGEVLNSTQGSQGAPGSGENGFDQRPQRSAQPPRSPSGYGQRNNSNRNNNRPNQPRDNREQREQREQREPREAKDPFNSEPQSARGDDDFQPRANAHLGTQSGVNAFGHKSSNSSQRVPDPTMTTVDLMSQGNRGGSRNNRGSSGQGLGPRGSSDNAAPGGGKRPRPRSGGGGGAGGNGGPKRSPSGFSR